jgi:unsaturated rhamnogalacturonyl hydrolase
LPGFLGGRAILPRYDPTMRRVSALSPIVIAVIVLTGCDPVTEDLPGGGGGVTSGGSGGFIDRSTGGTGGDADGTGGLADGAGGSGGSMTGVGGVSIGTGGGLSTGGSGGGPLSAYFQDWPDGADPATVGAGVAQAFVEHTPADPKHYKVACTWYGALAVTALLGEANMLSGLITRYDEYLGTYDELLAGPGHVDENVFGIVPLEISLHDEAPAYLEEGLALADHQRANIETQKRFAIDDMFMITGLQVQAFRASGDDDYLDFAASVMVEYLVALQQPDGLFFHHQDFEHRWARGNGWFAAGMAELLRELPESNPDYPAIRSGYELMMASLLNHQLTEGPGAGLWQQIVDSDDARNWPETSGSAMFTYAMVSGVRAGWLDAETYGPAARAGWLALVAKLTTDYEIQDVSDWAYKPESHAGGATYAGDEENYYFERPKLIGDLHGQAPVLWAAAELERALGE